jgi:hypothetical protein
VTSILVQIALALAGLTILVGLYLSYLGGDGLKGRFVTIAAVIAAAFIIAFLR